MISGWLRGEAFGNNPVSGAYSGQLEVTGFNGAFLANSFNNGDDSKGILTFREFKIERDYINFLLGSGMHDSTYIELL